MIARWGGSRKNPEDSASRLWNSTGMAVRTMCSLMRDAALARPPVRASLEQLASLLKHCRDLQLGSVERGPAARIDETDAIIQLLVARTAVLLQEKYPAFQRPVLEACRTHAAALAGDLLSRQRQEEQLSTFAEARRLMLATVLDMLCGRQSGTSNLKSHLTGMHSFELGRLPAEGGKTDVVAVAEFLNQLAFVWTRTALDSGDARFLNAALKCVDQSGRVIRAQQQSDRLATARAERIVVGRIVRTALDELWNWRRGPAGGVSPAADCSVPSSSAIGTGARIAVLTTTGSRGYPLFLEASASRQVTVHAAVIFREPEPDPCSGRQASAWYPPGADLHPLQMPCDPQAPTREAVVEGYDWQAAAAVLADIRPDLIVLLGMPVVPASVLSIASVGVINAHNGALPQYRGMDAVAWAYLNEDPVVCTAHYVMPRVDAGPVIAVRTLPDPWDDTLRQRVKTAQIDLLADIAAATQQGEYRTGREQTTASARHHFIVHPALRRALDRHYIACKSPTYVTASNAGRQAC